MCIINSFCCSFQVSTMFINVCVVPVMPNIHTIVSSTFELNGPRFDSHVREVGCQLPVAVYLFNRQLANGS